MNNYPPPASYPPPPAPKSSAGPVVAIVLGVLGIGCLGVVIIMAAILFPVFAKTREKAREVSCESNVKQICLGLTQFMQDNNDKFALKAVSYKDKAMPYIKSEQVFHCPSDSGGSGVSYSFNQKLEGVPIAKVKQPDTTIMVYEGQNQTLDFRHDNKAVVGFVDGSVRAIRQDEAGSLSWKP